MKRCPVCGADLAKAEKAERARRAVRKIARVRRWQAENRARYNAYMARFMRGYRKRKRAAASRAATLGTH
jgi:hypothetical protein